MSRKNQIDCRINCAFQHFQIKENFNKNYGCMKKFTT